jgi:hypothetical protein
MPTASGRSLYPGVGHTSPCHPLTHTAAYRYDANTRGRRQQRRQRRQPLSSSAPAPAGRLPALEHTLDIRTRQVDQYRAAIKRELHSGMNGISPRRTEAASNWDGRSTSRSTKGGPKDPSRLGRSLRSWEGLSDRGHHPEAGRVPIRTGISGPSSRPRRYHAATGVFPASTRPEMHCKTPPHFKHPVGMNNLLHGTQGSSSKLCWL